MYCCSIDKEHFNAPWCTMAEAKEEALELLKETGGTTYWIGKCVKNRAWDYVDSDRLLATIWDDMDWDDQYPSEEALDDMTGEDFEYLNKALGRVLANFAKKTGKLDFGTHIEDIKEFSTVKKIKKKEMPPISISDVKKRKK